MHTMPFPTNNNAMSSLWAAKFAQEIGLPHGNLWEPGIARAIAGDLKHMTREAAWDKWRLQLFGEAPQLNFPCPACKLMAEDYQIALAEADNAGHKDEAALLLDYAEAVGRALYRHVNDHGGIVPFVGWRYQGEVGTLNPDGSIGRTLYQHIKSHVVSASRLNPRILPMFLPINPTYAIRNALLNLKNAPRQLRETSAEEAKK